MSTIMSSFTRKRSDAESDGTGSRRTAAWAQKAISGSNVLAAGEESVDELFLTLRSEDRQHGGMKQFKLWRMTDIVASSKTVDDLVATLKAKMKILRSLSSFTLVVAELDLLPMIISKPQLVFMNEEPHVVGTRVNEMIDSLLELVSVPQNSLFAYCQIDRVRYVTDHKKLGPAFLVQTYISSG
ncbi:hypothetical protein NDN08_001556 [Rhodosorus marinus]|uniref:Uncharacterized protein n=1 Tax=Rhodosorus marinus TaxID=101924 RepID=A0AAV8UR50_9RHOD|nr:hypothetical protein NDN08_001556 [Rhodosorus marinus]